MQCFGVKSEQTTYHDTLVVLILPVKVDNMCIHRPDEGNVQIWVMEGDALQASRLPHMHLRVGWGHGDLGGLCNNRTGMTGLFLYTEPQRQSSSQFWYFTQGNTQQLFLSREGWQYTKKEPNFIKTV